MSNKPSSDDRKRISDALKDIESMEAEIDELLKKVRDTPVKDPDVSAKSSSAPSAKKPSAKKSSVKESAADKSAPEKPASKSTSGKSAAIKSPVKKSALNIPDETIPDKAIPDEVKSGKMKSDEIKSEAESTEDENSGIEKSDVRDSSEPASADVNSEIVETPDNTDTPVVIETEKANVKEPERARIILEYAGKALNLDEIARKALDEALLQIPSLAGINSCDMFRIYVKPEENRAFYVLDDILKGSIEI